MNKETYGKILTLVGVFGLLGSPGFLVWIDSDSEKCEIGYEQDRLIIDDTLYLQCGIENKTETYKAVKGDKIVTKTKLVEEEHTYIKSIDLNNVRFRWFYEPNPLVGLVGFGVFILSFGCLYVGLDLITKS